MDRCGRSGSLASFMACIMLKPALSNNPMKKKNSIVLALFGMAAIALAGLYVSSRDQDDRISYFDVPWTGTEDPDDPFQGCVEEGAGLIGQFRAEAAALARVHQTT